MIFWSWVEVSTGVEPLVMQPERVCQFFLLK